MSMLQLSSVRFPQGLSSSSASLSQSSTTTPAYTRSGRTTTEAHSAVRQECQITLPDHLPTQVMSPRSTIRSTSPENKPDFQCSDDVTMISDFARGMPNFEALSSSHQAAASEVSFLFGHPGSRETGVGHVSSRPSHRVTEAELDRESVATTHFCSQSRGKRSRVEFCACAERSR